MTRTATGLKLKLVSFDTSSSNVHLAIVDGDDIVRSEILQTDLAATGSARQEAANLLIPGIDRLFKECGFAKSDLDAIVVGSGPGSFTGIRTSIVTARALAQALSVPLLSVSLLDCYFSGIESEAIVVLQAATGFYFVTEGDGEIRNSYYLSEQSTKDFLFENANHPQYADHAAFQTLSKTEVKLVELKALLNVAVAQVEIACARLLAAGAQDFDFVDRRLMREKLSEQFNFENVLPVYLRDPSVTIKKATV